jgi:hypothetical protein
MFGGLTESPFLHGEMVNGYVSMMEDWSIDPFTFIDHKYQIDLFFT